MKEQVKPGMVLKTRSKLILLVMSDLNGNIFLSGNNTFCSIEQYANDYRDDLTYIGNPDLDIVEISEVNIGTIGHIVSKYNKRNIIWKR